MNKKQDKLVTELWLRLRDRRKQDIQDAELDLKILEKWKKDYLNLKKGVK
jgi:hypothetical protein